MDNCILWYLFFNEINLNEFIKEELRNEMMYVLNRFINNNKFVESLLFDDCECIIKIYIDDKKENKNLEDNNFFLLSELGLLFKIILSYGKEVI